MYSCYGMFSLMTVYINKDIKVQALEIPCNLNCDNKVTPNCLNLWKTFFGKRKVALKVKGIVYGNDNISTDMI